MKLKFKKMEPDASLPAYATAGAACFDLQAYAKYIDGSPASMLLSTSSVIRTGLQVEVPEGHVMLIFSRSGHGFNRGVRLANCVGVIDSDYRGELMVKLHCDAGIMKINDGDRIAQAMILQLPQVEIVEVTELTSTDRGEGGFGSTGK